MVIDFIFAGCVWLGISLGLCNFGRHTETIKYNMLNRAKFTVRPRQSFFFFFFYAVLIIT